MAHQLPTRQRPWSPATLDAVVKLARTDNRARALLQMALMEHGLTDDPERAALIVDLVAKGSQGGVHKLGEILEAHHQLRVAPPSAPLTGTQFDRQYPAQAPRRTRPLQPPELQTRATAALQPRPPRVASPQRWRLPAFCKPPLTPDDHSLMNRVPLQVWVERGVAPAWLPACTIAAAYVRLFGIGPPRATWTSGARSTRGYTPREIQLLLTALQITPD
jgi:hypothetical protein